MCAICRLEKGEGRAGTYMFGELGALPKIREEIVSESCFRIFPFYVSVVDGSC
jgi:hypothetical protein